MRRSTAWLARQAVRRTVGLRVAPLAAAQAAVPAGWAQRRFCAAPAVEPRTGVEVHVDHTPNPDCLKFSLDCESGDVEMMPDGVILDVGTAAEASQSLLAEELFKIEGVNAVCLGDYWLTVTKDTGREWEELTTQVVEGITKWAESGEPITTSEYVENDDTEIDPEFDTEVVQAIKELVKTRVRPGVQNDGGNIKYIGFEDGVVMLLMQGACQSCPSSGATLKGGIEKLMMHWIPEVVEVKQVDEDFAREYVKEMKELKKRYRLEGDKLVLRSESTANDDDLMNKSI